MVKQLRQVGGVEHVEIDDLKQGIFAVAPASGRRLSESALREAVRKSGFTPGRIVPPGGNGNPADGKPPADVRQTLSAARKAFHEDEYQRAARPLAGLLEQLPDETERDKARWAEAGQLLSLAYFAQGEFEKAASAAHAALHRGKPWAWKKLVGHYEEPETYTAQLRALEQTFRKKPSTDKRFLIAYHYLMLGHQEAARTQLRQVAEKSPEDEVVARLLKQLASMRDTGTR